MNEANKEIPIFDCLTHPSLDGSWLHPKWSGNNTFENIIDEMNGANVKWALAVAMGTSGGYDLLEYAIQAKKYSFNIFPVAYLDFQGITSLDDLESRLNTFVEQGYIGIKIHPRLAEIDLDHPWIDKAITIANQMNLSVLLCTYFFSGKKACCNCNIQSLYRLLHRLPEQKMILLHSGGVHLLEVMEMTRPFKNVLLDLSFTMCEYESSSIDLDIKFILNRHHFRVCIGSDSPEFSLIKMRDRFEALSEHIEYEKKINIAYKNLSNFLGVNCENTRT